MIPASHDLARQRLEEIAHTKAVRDAAALEIGDVLWLMNSEIGRRNVYRLMTRASLIFPVREQETNAMRCAHRDGQEFVCAVLKDQARTHCPELWVKMLAEAKEAAK